MTGAVPPGQIRFAVLDPLLYGVARTFDYLGIRGQDMLDRIGDGIVAYGLSEGYFESSPDPHQFVGNIVKFFKQNGYASDVQFDENADTIDIVMRNWRFLPLLKRLRDRGSYLLSCPVCIANSAVRRSVGLMGERVSETVTPDGIFSVKLEMIPGTQNTENTVIPINPADFKNTTLGSQMDENLGLPAFETVAYGLAWGFDYLGAQGQLILDNVGEEMLGFLREDANLDLPIDLGASLQATATFFADRGLADRIQVLLSKNEVGVEFKNSRYLPVLKKLLEEGRKLQSCPFTLAARAIIRNHGLQVGEMKWRTEAADASVMMAVLHSIPSSRSSMKTRSVA